MGLIMVDMCISFRVAKFKHGRLLVDKQEIALDYLKTYFLIDLISGEGGGLAGLAAVA